MYLLYWSISLIVHMYIDIPVYTYVHYALTLPCPHPTLTLPSPYPLVGGIYTVIRSKADVSVEELGDQYCLMGPMNEQYVRIEVEVLDPTLDPRCCKAMRLAIEQMREHGIKVSAGGGGGVRQAGVLGKRRG